jgi:hypothetical protein
VIVAGNTGALLRRFKEPENSPFATKFAQILSSTVLVNAQFDVLRYITFDGIVGSEVNNGQYDISNELNDDGNVVTHKLNSGFDAKDIETIWLGKTLGGYVMLVFEQKRFVTPYGIINGNDVSGLFDTSIYDIVDGNNGIEVKLLLLTFRYDIEVFAIV